MGRRQKPLSLDNETPELDPEQEAAFTCPQGNDPNIITSSSPSPSKNETQQQKLKSGIITIAHNFTHCGPVLWSLMSTDPADGPGLFLSHLVTKLL